MAYIYFRICLTQDKFPTVSLNCDSVLFVRMERHRQALFSVKMDEENKPMKNQGGQKTRENLAVNRFPKRWKMRSGNWQLLYNYTYTLQ